MPDSPTVAPSPAADLVPSACSTGPDVIGRLTALEHKLDALLQYAAKAEESADRLVLLYEEHRPQIDALVKSLTTGKLGAVLRAIAAKS